MKKHKVNRSRFVGIRFTPEEYDLLTRQSSQTTTPQLSEFIRKVLFEKPVTIKQRNQSLDDVMTEVIRLRNELHLVGNNFNQAVKKLHTLVQVAEFRTWVQLYENDRQSLVNMVGEIQQHINILSDKWLQ